MCGTSKLTALVTDKNALLKKQKRQLQQYVLIMYSAVYFFVLSFLRVLMSIEHRTKSILGLGAHGRESNAASALRFSFLLAADTSKLPLLLSSSLQ